MLDKLLEQAHPLEDGDSKMFAMIYGGPGVGKTILAMEMAQILRKDKKILHVDYANGRDSLKNARWRHLAEHTDFLPTQRMAVLSLLADSAAKLVEQYDVLVIDEATALYRSNLGRITEERAKKDSQKDPDVPMQPDYNSAQRQFAKLWNKLAATPITVIAVCHERSLETDSGIEKTSPAFPPGAASEALEPVSLCCRVVRQDKQGVTSVAVLTQPTRKEVAKSRFPEIPALSLSEEFLSKFKSIKD